jgi:hypothetical protein
MGAVCMVGVDASAGMGNDETTTQERKEKLYLKREKEK